jgi:hypothetical protein
MYVSGYYSYSYIKMLLLWYCTIHITIIDFYISIMLFSVILDIFTITMGKKLVYKSTTVTDRDGNFLENRTTHISSGKAESDFVKMYLDDLALLKGLTPTEGNVLYELLKRMDYNNEISLSTGAKKEICHALEMYSKAGRGKGFATLVDDKTNEPTPSTNSLNGIINRLCEKEIFFKKDKGLYQVNPFLFGKGRWADIDNIRVTVDYTPQGKRQETAIKKASDRVRGIK